MNDDFETTVKINRKNEKFYLTVTIVGENNISKTRTIEYDIFPNDIADVVERAKSEFENEL